MQFVKKGKADELFTQGSIVIYNLFTASFSLYFCRFKSAVSIRVQLWGAGRGIIPHFDPFFGISTFWGYIQVLTKMLGLNGYC